MWILSTHLAEIALRATVIYLVVLAGVRLTGKRQIGQMTPFDLVLLLLIANAVQNAMTGPDTSVLGGIAAAATLLIVNAVVTRLSWRYRRIHWWVEGRPTLLIHQGRILAENLARERITEDELHEALREHGVASPADVSLAVLEVDGSISVLKSEEMPTTPRSHHRIRIVRRH